MFTTCLLINLICCCCCCRTALFSPLALCAIDALSNKDKKIAAPTVPAVRRYVETVLCGAVRIHNALPPTVLCSLLEQNNIAAKDYAVQVWATDSSSKVLCKHYGHIHITILTDLKLVYNNFHYKCLA